MKTSVTTLIAASAFAASCHAASLDTSLLPDFRGGKYKVGPYITAAAKLQEMGRESACQTLLQAAQTNQHGRQIIVLCRMLFTNRGPSEFRRPQIGGARFIAGTDYPDWPLEPIELVEGYPFLITQGYTVAGVPERADTYVNYCVTNCDWSTFRFHEPTPQQKRDALASIVASSKWKRPL